MRSVYFIVFSASVLLALLFAFLSVTFFESTKREENLHLAVTVFCEDGERPRIQFEPSVRDDNLMIEISNEIWGEPIKCYEIDLSGPEDTALPDTSGYAIVLREDSDTSGGGCSQFGVPNDRIPLQVVNDHDVELDISLRDETMVVFCLRLLIQDTSVRTSLSQRRLSLETSLFQHPSNSRATLPVEVGLARGFSPDELLPLPDDVYLSEYRRIYVWGEREQINRQFIDIYFSDDRLRYIQEFLFLLSASILGAIFSMVLTKLYDKSKLP